MNGTSNRLEFYPLGPGLYPGYNRIPGRRPINKNLGYIRLYRLLLYDPDFLKPISYERADILLFVVTVVVVVFR